MASLVNLKPEVKCVMHNKYSISEILENIYYLVVTKITMPQARFIRRPIYIRGWRLVEGCEKLTTGRFCRFDLAGNAKTLHIGYNCSMGDMTHIVAHESVTIGRNVLIASKCFISDTSHGDYSEICSESPDVPPAERKLITEPVVIGDNVWIGENVVILKGSHIGNGCIIGANSIVTKSIPPYSIVVGTNKIIKKYDFNNKIWRGVIDPTPKVEFLDIEKQ